MIKITPVSRLFYFVISMSFAAEIIQAKLTINLVDRSLISISIGLIWAYIEVWDLMRDFRLQSFTKLKDWLCDELGWLFVEGAWGLNDFYDVKVNPEQDMSYNYEQHWWYNLSGRIYSIGNWFYFQHSDFDDLD